MASTAARFSGLPLVSASASRSLRASMSFTVTGLPASAASVISTPRNSVTAALRVASAKARSRSVEAACACVSAKTSVAKSATIASAEPTTESQWRQMNRRVW